MNREDSPVGRPDSVQILLTKQECGLVAGALMAAADNAWDNLHDAGDDSIYMPPEDREVLKAAGERADRLEFLLSLFSRLA